jgi:hypothetical protein
MLDTTVTTTRPHLQETYHGTTTRLYWCCCCTLDVTLNTTGPSGGDSGHGGFTEIIIKGEGGAAMEVGVNNARPRRVESVVLRFCGDDEMAGIAAVLQAVAKRLAQ